MEKKNSFSLSFYKGRLVLLLSLFALSLLLSFLLAKFLLPHKLGDSASLSLALSLLFSVLLPFAFCLYVEEGSVFEVRPSVPSPRVLGRFFFATLAAAALFLGYKALLSFLGKGLSYTVLAVTPEAVTPLSLVAFAILPAFLEEWLCRGLVFSGLSEYGGWPLAILSAILFTVLYFPSPLAIPFFFLLGLLFGLLRASLQSFYPTLLIALGLRLFMLFDAVNPLPFWHLEGQNMLLLSLACLSLFLLFSGFALVFPQMKHALKGEREAGASLRTLFLSPVLLCTLFMTLIFYVFLY